VYVTLRFDFRYAPGGVAALLHDAVVTMGVVSLLNLKFSLQVLAAVLTVIGYSINDSIIIYDRVRENFAAHKGRDLIELLNRSINNTLSRTVLTSGSTLLAVLSILIFGGGQVADFAITLFAGIILGTYSTIFIAVPFVLYLDSYLKRRAEEKKGDGRSGSGGKRSQVKRDSTDDKKAAKASA
jgi:preprotein translocase subunit SecF